MEDNQKRYIDKVAEIIVRDTIIDYDNEEITFPFMGGYDPYPFRHLTPYHYIFFTKPTKIGRGKAVPPFIRYCKDTYGLDKGYEIEHVWVEFKRKMRVLMNRK